MLTYRDYLDYAERSLLDARNTHSSKWLLIPATILSWSAIESFVNNMLDDFASLPEDIFELHEKAFLLEKRLSFVDHGENIGQFEIVGREYRKLDNKIFFLLAKCEGQDTKSVKGATLWLDFKDFKDMRDALVHPRRDKDLTITIEKVESFIKTSKSIIQLISKNVWKKEVNF